MPDTLVNKAKSAAMSHRNRQAGYLLEVPVILMATALILAFVLPSISGITRQITLTVGILICTGCLYYVLLTPGWQPGDGGGRLPLWRRLLWFGLVALSALGTLWHTWYGCLPGCGN